MKNSINIFFIFILIIFISSNLNAEEKNKKQGESFINIDFKLSPIFSHKIIKTTSLNAPYEKTYIYYPGLEIESAFGEKKIVWMQLDANFIGGKIYSEYTFDCRLNLLKVFFIAGDLNKSKLRTNSLLPYDASFEYYIYQKRDVIETRLFKKFGVFSNILIAGLNNQIDISYISADYKIRENRNEIGILINKEVNLEGYEISARLKEKILIFNNPSIKITKVSNRNAKITILNASLNILKRLKIEYLKNNEEILQFFRNDQQFTIAYEFKF